MIEQVPAISWIQKKWLSHRSDQSSDYSGEEKINSNDFEWNQQQMNIEYDQDD